MNNFKLPSCLVLFLTIVCCVSAQNKIYIKAGTFYDSRNNELVRNKLIVIENDRIIEIKNFAALPEDVDLLDLSEYTVLPGLIDAHTHVLFSQNPDEDFSERSIQTLVLESDALRVLRGESRAKSYLDVGITTIKDLGNSGQFLDVALRDAINESTSIGPRMYVSGPILSSSGGQIYGVNKKNQDLVDLEYRVIKSVDDARNAVRDHINLKVDLIKICADNIPNNTRLTFPEMEAIVETAHSYGVPVTAHSITNQSAWDAVKAGVDGIEHGFFIADSTLSLMAENDVYLVPTENSRMYMENYNKLAGETDMSFIDNYISNMQSRLKRAIKFNVPIIAGSDNYTDMKTSRGKSSQDMFRVYFESGMDPLNILQSATYLSAKHLNKSHEIGELKANSKADIIAVKGNIENNFLATIENIVLVIRNGIIYLNKLD